MGHRALAAALLAFGAAACGDPIVVLGDWPGILRVAAGVTDPDVVLPDSSARATPLFEPVGLAVDDAGVLYIAEATARVLALQSDGTLRTLHDAAACAGLCPERVAAAAFHDGDLLLSDPRQHRIWRLDATTGAVSVVAGTGASGFSPDGSAAATSPILVPAGLAVTDDGRILFSERAAHRVRAIEPDGTLSTIAGTGVGGYSGDGGAATAARLHQPAGLALGGGVLYIADAANHRVRAVGLAAGLIGTVAGSGEPGDAGDGGAATLAQLTTPDALAISTDALTLYIADPPARRVRSVALDAGTIAAFAGTGADEYAGEGDAAAATPIGTPAGLTASSFGLLFIASSSQNLVWRAAIRF